MERTAEKKQGNHETEEEEGDGQEMGEEPATETTTVAAVTATVADPCVSADLDEGTDVVEEEGGVSDFVISPEQRRDHQGGLALLMVGRTRITRSMMG